MFLDEAHPGNQLLLARRRAAHADRAPIAPPGSEPYAYMNLGAHPDIVERLWDRINPQLPEDSRAIVYAGPALVHPTVGLVIALAYGTSYVLRIPDVHLDEAMHLGCTPTHTWSNRTSTDIASDYGHGWLFGNWAARESEWLSGWWPRG